MLLCIDVDRHRLPILLQRLDVPDLIMRHVAPFQNISSPIRYCVALSGGACRFLLTERLFRLKDRFAGGLSILCTSSR